MAFKWHTSCSIALLPLASYSDPASSESLKDFWAQKPIIASLSSAKTSAGLEMCLALQGGENGTPVVVHGDGETLVSIMLPGGIISTIIGFRLKDSGPSRTIDVVARGSALGTWVRHANQIARECA